jgi:hypothetical protein
MRSKISKAEIERRKPDVAAMADVNEGIRQGLEDLKKGKVRPAEEVFAEFEKRHGIAKSMPRARSTRK